MGTELNTRAPASPSIKLRNVGDYVDVQVIDIAVVPRYEYGTQRVKEFNGKPLTQDKVTVLVVGGKGVIADDKDNLVEFEGQTLPGDRPAQPGEVAVIHFASRDRWDPDLDKTRTGDVGRSFSGAQEARGGLQVGDVLRWKFEREQPGKGSQPRKIRTVQLRAPKPGEEAERAQRCEQLRIAATQTSLSSSGDGPDGGYADEEPF